MVENYGNYDNQMQLFIRQLIMISERINIFTNQLFHNLELTDSFMIKQLKISNFRCYDESVITFNGTSILVGRNNAGKSTMIEALKIISCVTRKYKTSRFIAPPDWIPDATYYGISPNVENMNISDRGIFNMYGNPPAIIEAVFTNGNVIKAYVGEGLDIFAVLIDRDGNPIRNSKEVKYLDIPVIEVLPQISAVLDTEKVIKKTTVDGNRLTRLASRNFRNQLLYYNESFPVFKELVESTWEGLIVKPVESLYSDDGRIIHFYVRVGNFEAEIGWMGHGLQMWVQAMWFISQCPSNAIVVLDEPDVYMHADLQRRLVRLVKPMFSQLIVATHSLEIIEEVSSECIIPIDSRKPVIKPIGDELSLHLLSEELGCPFNIDLARIFISNRFIIWDGDDHDRKVLSAFQSILYPKDLHPLITFPKAFVEGWNGWKKAITISDVFSSNNIPLQLYCIFNSGFHTELEKQMRMNDALKREINLHIWDKREIDNYAINPYIIYQYFNVNRSKGELTVSILKEKMDSIIESLKEEVFNELIEELHENPFKQSDTIYEQAKVELEAKCNNPTDIISGRKFFNTLSLWSQETLGIGISALQLIPYFSSAEILPEIKQVIGMIIDSENVNRN